MTLPVLLLALGGPLAAQEPIELRGRVIDSASSTGIAGAVVTVGDRAATTDDVGAFLFRELAAGRFTVSVEALGYRSEVITVVAARDTTLTIALEVAPIPLDTIPVVSRTVTVRGEVVDTSGIGLIDVEITAPPDHREVTDPLGRFRIRDVPTGAPFSIAVRGFGYLPFSAEIVPTNDTTIVVRLEEDPIVQQMIDKAVQRLDDRSRSRRSSLMPAIDRDELMQRLNWSLGDILDTRYDFHLDRVRCVLIDEVQRRSGMAELALMLPDRIQRVEVLEQGRMLRVYTRDFVRRMLAGGVNLRPPLYVDRPPEPYCR